MNEPDELYQHEQEQLEAEYYAEQERLACEEMNRIAMLCPLCGDFTGGGYCPICIKELL